MQVGAWSGVAASAGEAVEALLPYLPSNASGTPRIPALLTFDSGLGIRVGCAGVLGY